MANSLSKPSVFISDHRKIGLILAVTSGFFLFTAWMVVPAAPAGFTWDDTWYLWMAEWYSGRTDFQQIALSMMQARQYPPFFPFVLSMTGEVLFDIKPGLLMNAAFLATGTGVAMVWLMHEGTTRVAAILGGALIMFNPTALAFLPALMSEPLFILLTVMAILLASLDRESFTVWFATGLLAGLSVATRSAGWALVAALLVQLVLQRKPRLLLFYLPGLAMGLLGIVYLKAGLPGAQNYLQGYLENLSSLGWTFLLNQAGAIMAGWHQLWGSVAGAVVAVVIVVPGLIIRLVRARADAWYVVISFIMLMAWPFPEQMSRFLWVLLPAFLLAAQTSTELVGDRRRRASISIAALALIMVISIPGGVGKSLDRLLDPPGAELNHLSRLASWTRSDDRETGRMNLRVRQQFLNDMEHIKEIAKPEFCIHSELPAMVSIRTLKVSYASRWNSLENVRPEDLNCRYYYLIPDALPGVSGADVERFADIHQELFRSLAPYDASGQTILGAFFFLFPPETGTD